MTHGETYQLRPGSTFTFFPSGFGPGIPGCSPGTYECGFTVEGTVDFDISAALVFPGMAQITAADLRLVGNEGVQSNPPLFGIVTAERLEELLLSLDLRQLPTAAPTPSYEDNGVFASTTFATLALFGGRDDRPVDGHGFALNLLADVVPEPHAALLAFGALGAAASVAPRGARPRGLTPGGR